MRQEIVRCDVCGDQWTENPGSARKAEPFVVQYAPHMKSLIDMCENCNEKLNKMIIEFVTNERGKSNDS